MLYVMLCFSAFFDALTCLSSSRYTWNCSKCEFDACDDCLKQYNVEFHHHPLIITDSRNSYNEFDGKWKCDHCGFIGGQYIPGKDKSFHCAICKYDVCFACMERRIGWPNMGNLFHLSHFLAIFYQEGIFFHSLIN